MAHRETVGAAAPPRRDPLLELQSIARVAEAVDRCERLDDVFAAALEELVLATTADRASILLFDDAGVMRFRAWRGLSDAYRAAVDGHSPWTPDVRDPTALDVADVLEDPELAPFRDTIAGEGIRALAFVPLVHRGRLVGKFMLYRAEPGTFHPVELELARTVGSLVAAAGERRRVEEALVRSRGELEAILRQVGDGITVQDPTGAVVYANDAAARLIGFDTASELLATPVADVIRRFEMFDEDGLPFPVERLPGRLALAGAESERLIRYRAAGGGDRWSVVRATPIRDENGEIRFAVNTFHDVTTRKRVEQRMTLLAETAKLFAASRDYERTLAEIARVAVPLFADWCIVYVRGEDGAIARLAVQHAREDVAHVLEQLDRFRLRPDAQTGVPAVIASGEPMLVREAAADMVAADVDDPEGLARVLEPLGLRSWICVPLRTPDDTLGALSFVTADSERRYGDEDLALAQEVASRAAAAIENATLVRELDRRAQAAAALAFTAEGVCLVDTDGIIRIWNPAAAAIAGLREEDAVGRPLRDVLPGWTRVEAQRGEHPDVVPVDLVAGERWLSVSTTTFPDGTVYAFRDLTHERALDRLKSDFISTVSHELRTPLAAIYGASVTLQRPDLEDEPEQRATLLGVIATEAERLARTINDVLWASRLESGTMHVQIESCDAAELAGDVVAAARTHLPANLELEFDGPAARPRVAADRDKVRQVLANLIDNAVKYSPEGGRIRVSVAAAGRCVRFEVVDEGLGIPASEHGRIFEKFYRLDPNLTRGVGGTGLGLYICRELVARMDGRIVVASAEGAGSTFTVELPVAS